MKGGRAAAARGAALAAGLWVTALGGSAGCGGSQHPGEGDRAGGPPPAPVADPRTPIERRRDAACEQLGPKITACAVEDARVSLAGGKIDQRQFERDTAAAVQRRHTEEFEKACKGATYSSRQIRVLEVCFRDEPRCGPLLDCLGHLSDRAPGGDR